MELRIKRKILLVLILLFLGTTTAIFMNQNDTSVLLRLDKKLPIYCVDTEDKKISLTIDVSWGNDNTEKILDILDKYNIKATFFVVGGWVDQYPDRLKEIYKRGHEIGNHSNKHPDMTKLSRENIIKDMHINDAKIRNLTGEGTKLFRCPEGAYNDLVVKTVEEAGYYCIQWDVDSIDWKEQGADIEYNRVIKNTKPGSILLFHNNAKYTPENLPRIIEKFQSEGYQFVKTGDLIYKDNYKVDYAGKQISN
ncbi:polysaccharide deacetylase family sporulation protein PdaB [Clostridium sp. CX1]|uniref:polysaccharide deacetylase family sporulation protein PdaB n=1 Tax=Clostridium sp. CX1 TaxID=2978346 RepID=UPI0021BFD2A0|nr:polysaccharide deacetylase family sporulation protein PdaB [Clostridium sp. CX1]MCT8977315.1 polysaccharide deacetylase family sporulation protein PdaB [Clostridium sp. CX1]